jgi:hypothetical protein
VRRAFADGTDEGKDERDIALDGGADMDGGGWHGLIISIRITNDKLRMMKGKGKAPVAPPNKPIGPVGVGQRFPTGAVPIYAGSGGGSRKAGEL